MKEKSSRSKFLWFPSRLSSALPYIPLICNSCTTDFCSSKVAPKTFCQLWKNKTVLETIKNKKNVKWQSEKPAIAFALCCLLTEILRLHLRSGKHKEVFDEFPSCSLFVFQLFSLYRGGEESTCVFPKHRICTCGLRSVLLNTEKQN